MAEWRFHSRWYAIESWRLWRNWKEAEEDGLRQVFFPRVSKVFHDLHDSNWTRSRLHKHILFSKEDVMRLILYLSLLFIGCNLDRNGSAGSTWDIDVDGTSVSSWEGIVRDSVSGMGIAGATVSMWERTDEDTQHGYTDSVTNGEGHFCVRPVVSWNGWGERSENGDERTVCIGGPFEFEVKAEHYRTDSFSMGPYDDVPLQASGEIELPDMEIHLERETGGNLKAQ